MTFTLSPLGGFLGPRPPEIPKLLWLRMCGYLVALIKIIFCDSLS